MEILFNLFFILPIIYWFYKIKDTLNPYVFIGILILSSLGVIITISSTPYITEGLNTTYTFDGGQSTSHPSGSVVEPIKQDLGGWSYVLLLFYLLSMVGSVVYWSLRGELD